MRTFGRICIQVDLHSSFVPSVRTGKSRIQHIQYKGVEFALNVGSLGISHHLAHKQKNRSMYMLKFFSVTDKCPDQSHKTHPTDVRDFEGTPP